MRYQKRVITYQPIDVSPVDLIGLFEAADLLGVSKSTLRSMVERGQLTEIKDTQPPHGGRHLRWLLRREVEDEARIRRA
jgi:excisionase family DNA binding protein